MSDDRFQTMNEFFPYYLTEHRSSTSRYLHYVGSTMAVLALVSAIALLNPWLLIAVPLVSYPLAWVGHFFIEHNRPATFKYPVWSLLSDYRMMYLELTGQLAARMPLGDVQPGVPVRYPDAA